MLDASHRTALLFSDDDAVCTTMKATSSIGGALQIVVSSEEFVLLLIAKIDAIIMTLLQAYVKDKSGNGKMARDGSLTTAFANRLRVYTEFAALETSPIIQCLDVLKSVLVLVDPKRAKVHDFVVAAELMDNDKDDINNPLLRERSSIQVNSCAGGWVCEMKQKIVNKHTSVFPSSQPPTPNPP